MLQLSGLDSEWVDWQVIAVVLALFVDCFAGFYFLPRSDSSKGGCSQKGWRIFVLCCKKMRHVGSLYLYAWSIGLWKLLKPSTNFNQIWQTVEFSQISHKEIASEENTAVWAHCFGRCQRSVGNVALILQPSEMQL